MFLFVLNVHEELTLLLSPLILIGGINVKVNADGYVAIVHDVVDTYIDTIPWLVAEDDTLNWFKVHWSGDYPGSSEVSSRNSIGRGLSLIYDLHLMLNTCPLF